MQGNREKIATPPQVCNGVVMVRRPRSQMARLPKICQAAGHAQSRIDGRAAYSAARLGSGRQRERRLAAARCGLGARVPPV